MRGRRAPRSSPLAGAETRVSPHPALNAVCRRSACVGREAISECERGHEAISGSKNGRGRLAARGKGRGRSHTRVGSSKVGIRKAIESARGRAATGALQRVCSARETWRWAWVRRRRRLRIQREKEVHEHGGPWAMRVAGGGRDPVCRSLRVRVRSGHQCPWTVSSGLRRGVACVCERETDPGVGERASERDWGRLGVVGGRVRRACCREPQEFRVTHNLTSADRSFVTPAPPRAADCASTRGAARPR